jgi:hypothetical protein
VQYIAAISSASTGFAAANGTNQLLVDKLGGKVTMPPAPPVMAQVLNPPENFGDDVLHKHGRCRRRMQKPSARTSLTAPMI